MKIQEKTIWWTIVTLCTLLQLARIISPSLANQPSFVRIQLFALATIISIAVSASVIRSALFGKSEKTSDFQQSVCRVHFKKNGKGQLGGEYHQIADFGFVQHIGD